MHLAPLIHDLAIILAIAGLITLLFHRIRQPVVLGYIFAGILVGPYTPLFQLVTDLQGIQTWAEIGVIFLMFTLGLEFSFRKLARVGGSATITTASEVLFFLPAGYLVGRLLKWSSMDSLFLGAMLSISSTTIIIKALDELKLKRHRFAELIFATLIVEDLVAIILLVALGTIAATQTISAIGLLSAATKLILVVGTWFISGYLIVPRFVKYVGRIGNDEILTIVSLGLCLALVVLANFFHYSSALGAFIMGSIIAESPAIHRIEKNMSSLRDLFGSVFFVSIGMLIDPKVIWANLGTIAILCSVTIFGKIISTSIGSLISGQSVRNSIQVGFGLAQIGEFSFIIAQLGLVLNVTSHFVYPIIVAVSLVTTFTTPYLIRISGRVANEMDNLLPQPLKSALNLYALNAEARRARGRDKSVLRNLGLKDKGKQWIQIGRRIVSVFEFRKQSQTDAVIEFSHLAPWDAHLVKMDVHPNSKLVLKRISDVALRSRYGINIVAIQRGHLSIVTPMPDEMILPRDELIILGTDKQVEEIKKEFEEPDEFATFSESKSTYQLRQVILTENCTFVGQTIRQTRIRENFHAMIVGVERKGLRLINPESDMQLLLGDTLWIAGEKEKLDRLITSIVIEPVNLSKT